MRVLLAVDVSNNIYKAAATNPSLVCDDRFTGGLFGFLHALAKAIIMTKATDLVLCWDSRPYVRSESYPEYKALRATNRDEELAAKARETEGYIKQLIEVLGLPTWAVSGFESDDLIALAVVKYRGRYGRIIAASNDSDLYQLFKYPTFAIWRGKGGMYELEDFYSDYILEPDQFVTMLSLTGTHNEVAGIKGVGDVTATRACSEPHFMRQLRIDHHEIIDRNAKLISLPHPQLPRRTCLPTKTSKFRDRDLLKFCARFDINVSQAMLDAFNQISS